MVNELTPRWPTDTLTYSEGGTGRLYGYSCTEDCPPRPPGRSVVRNGRMLRLPSQTRIAVTKHHQTRQYQANA